ncbi:MAG: hypothetical protein CME06_14065 [Gemmatimonadetes bacterium]|nr:hypothetical protein [Gemmatimonadota bacterium]
MNAIDILVAEHGLIRQFLDNLTTALGKMERGEKIPKTFFEHSVLFSRELVDKHHHFKEELQMFTLLAQKHGGQFDTAIEGLRNQHENGRNHVAEIDYAKEGYEAGQESATTTLPEHLDCYISMLRQHINREDHRLYPMAREAYSAGEMEGLLVELQRADEKAGEGFFETNRDRVLKMGALLNG